MECKIVFSFICKILAIISFVIVIILSAFASMPIDGLYQTTTGAVSDKYSTSFTPAGFTFSIWSLIYIWQTAIIAYLIASFFLKNINYEARLYENTTFHSAWFYFAYAFTGVLNCIWIILWDRSFTNTSIQIACCVILYLLSALLYVNVFLSYREVSMNRADLKQHKRLDLLWSHRIIQQNGLSIYAAWTTIAMHVNLSTCLIYITKVDKLTAGYISMALLLVMIFIYFFLDLLLWDAHTRYTLTPHCVFLWAAGGIYSKNSTLNELYLIEVLLAVGAVAVVVKVIMIIVRTLRSRGQKDAA